MKISQLARSTGTAADTIRYYEREGLLPAPARDESNYRRYDNTHTERLNFIRQARGLDMSLDEIRTLLAWRDQPAASCSAVNSLVDEHIGHITTRIRELRALERQLRELRARCQQASATADCGILVSLSQDAVHDAEPPAASSHVGGAHGLR